MEINTSCNTASIAPFVPSGSNEWDAAKAKHVYRRVGFGTSQAQINIALASSPSDFIDSIIDEAIATANSPVPEWANWSFEDYNDYDLQSGEQNQYIYRQTTNYIKDSGLKGRLAFFWHNHFVTEKEVYNHPPYAYQYWDVLETYALGNFKEFTRAVGISNAMLLYLNGFENSKFSPNENYARELYELFTLGENNGYTQDDIVETSRALTGYNQWDDYGGQISFNSNNFDDTNKTIFGQTENFGYDEVIDLLFQEKSSLIATFICTKLYHYFVSRDVNEVIIQEMATTFVANDFEIVPVLQQLLKSDHFFDTDATGLIVKSPFDLTSIYLNELGFAYNTPAEDYTDFILYLNANLGQEIFEPTDVAGWQRDRDWISTSTLTGRWLSMEYLTWPMWNEDEQQFREFARDLTINSADPAIITRAIVDFFLSKPLYTDTDYDIATTVFRWEVPENYYDDGTWNLDWDSAAYQVLLLMHHIFRMPEFQLK